MLVPWWGKNHTDPESAACIHTYLDLLAHEAVVAAVDARDEEEEGQPAACGQRHELVQAVEEEHPADQLFWFSECGVI